jgi:prevent-host-death family protein
MDKIKVGIRELKSKLSENLRRVKSGQTIVITERGKPIGQIMPIEMSLEERLHLMVPAGVAEWNGKKLKPYKPVAINRGDRQISDLVVEDRQ